jgi:hypothetical protein
MVSALNSKLNSKHKIGLNDTHYLASFDKKDLPLLQKWASKIRNGERSEELAKIFFKLLDSKLNDHHPKPDPLAVSKDEKYLLTWKGIAKMCRLITQQDSTGFRDGGVAVGLGSTTPQPYDTQLVNEASYIDFATNGFFDGSGTSIRYAGFFGSSVPTNTFQESLVRNQTSAVGSTVLCRNIFVNNPMVHTQGNAGFAAAGVIEFVPIV